jgi:putative ABC transport system permease protein
MPALRRPERWSVRLYRSVLVAYPPEFRAAYERELCLVFIDRWRQATSAAERCAVLLRALAGVAHAAPTEHLHMILQDLRYACRMLRKSPLVSFVSLLVLALGIGATTLAFSIANGVLLRPLPYPHAERLVAVDESALQRNEPSIGVAFPNYQDFRARNRVFAEIALYTAAYATLAGSESPARISAAQVSAGLFKVLGVHPLAGRVFESGEDLPQGPRAVILGEGIWRERFGGDRGLIGRSIQVNGSPATLVGVMPAGFRLDATLSRRTDHNLLGMARLLPGITLEQADDQLKRIMRDIARENPVTYQGQTVNVLPFRHQLTRTVRTPVITVMVAVLCVLLIACANIANLMLVQATDRAREMAVRSALGAAQSRLVRQLLLESLLLSALGAVTGIALAYAGKPLLLALIPVDLPSWLHFEIDGRVLAFTAIVTLVTTLLVSLAPAHLSARLRLTEALKEGGRSGSGGRRSEHIRHLLVVGEVAISVCLLIAAGLLGRSFVAMQMTPTGFQASHVLSLNVWAPRTTYDTAAKARALVHRECEEVGSLPGVVSVAATIAGIPLADSWGRSLTVEGRPFLRLLDAPMINHIVATPGYFQTLDIPLLAGRDFNPADGAAKLTIIDQELAERYWPHASALGHRVRFGPPEDNEPWHTIIGVVGSVRNQSRVGPASPSVYLPHAEYTEPRASVGLLIRTQGDPGRVTGAIRQRLARIDRDLAPNAIRPLEEVVASSTWEARFYATLVVIFAALALLLAAAGLFGVMSYTVSRRRRELGMRAALGASAAQLRGLVIGQVLRLAASGIVIGSLVALVLTRLIAGQLYAVRPADPPTYLGTAAILLVAAIAASTWPSRRAVRSDPMEALRNE